MLGSARTEKEGMGGCFQKLISVMWPVSTHEKPHGTKEALGLQWTSVWKVPLCSALWRRADSVSWWNACSSTSPSLCRSEKRSGDSWSGYTVITEFWRSPHTFWEHLAHCRSADQQWPWVCQVTRESTWAPKGTKKGIPKESGQRQSSTWTRQLTLSSPTSERPRKDPRPLCQ